MNCDIEPQARWGHNSVAIGGRAYVWAGCTKDLPSTHSSPEKTRLLSQIFVFDIQQSRWALEQASGEIPPAVRDAATTTDDSTKIFSFGGYCGHDLCWYNSLHVLHYKNNYLWEKRLASPRSSRLPMKKQDCGIVYFRLDEDEEYLCVVGGAGGDSDDYVCTNEVHLYNLSNGDWEEMAMTGSHPPPCSGLSLTKYQQDRAIMFGGRSRDGIVHNDLYILNFSDRTWEKVMKPLETVQSWPGGRESHVGVAIGSQLLVAGGLSADFSIYSDSWMYDHSQSQWRKVNMHVPVDICQRCSSTGSAVCTNGHWYLVIFGGLDKYIKAQQAPSRWPFSSSRVVVHQNEQSMISKTRVLIFEDPTQYLWYDLSPMGCQLSRKLNNTLSELTKIREQQVVGSAQLRGYDSQRSNDSSYYRQGSENTSRGSRGGECYEQFANVDDTILNDKSMSEILIALTDIAPEWKLLGCALGIKTAVIQSISKELPHSSPKELMMSLLVHWLNKSGTKPPTWRELAIAVSGLVENERVAREIANNHCSTNT